MFEKKKTHKKPNVLIKNQHFYKEHTGFDE